MVSKCQSYTIIGNKKCAPTHSNISFSSKLKKGISYSVKGVKQVALIQIDMKCAVPKLRPYFAPMWKVKEKAIVFKHSLWFRQEPIHMQGLATLK